MNTFNLENEPKIKSGFKSPDTYFEAFSEKVMQRLPEKEPQVIALSRKRKNLFLAAAAVLILALMVPVFNSVSNSKSLDENALENYFAYQSGISQYDLLTLLEPEDIDKINIEMPFEDEAVEDFLTTNTNLDYLITE